MTITPPLKKKKRNTTDWLLSARGIAMLGVYWGHLMYVYYTYKDVQDLKPVLLLFDPTATAFFMLLSGAFFSAKDFEFKHFIWFKFTQRLLPVLLYAVLVLIAAWLLPQLAGDRLEKFIGFIPFYLIGIPLISWSCWFLVALFSAELCYFYAHRVANTEKTKLIASLGFCLLAWALNRSLEALGGNLSALGMPFSIQAVPIFCSMFFLGGAFRPKLIRAARIPKWKPFLTLIISFIILWFSMNYNDFTPLSDNTFRNRYSPEGMAISIGQYGQLIPFIISIYSGVLFFTCLCLLTPPITVLKKIGEHSLVLLGVNGIFLAFLNIAISRHISLDDFNQLEKFAVTLALAALTLLASMPLVLLLEKYLPQLVGKPMLKGPLLPPIYKKSS